MDTEKCIKLRRSIRDFKEDDVSTGIVQDIIKSAIEAPSSGNVQDWEFIIVRDPQRKAELTEAAIGQDFIKKAPVVVVVCSDLDKVTKAYGERGRSLYSIQNISAAIENLLLAAWNRGIGSCWVGAFNEERVKEILILPQNVRPMGIIPLGYPNKIPEKIPRRGVKECIHFERY